MYVCVRERVIWWVLMMYVYMIRCVGCVCSGSYKQEGQVYLVSEFCEKGSLTEVLATRKNMSWGLKGHLALGIARGLSFLHSGQTISLTHTQTLALSLDVLCLSVSVYIWIIHTRLQVIDI